MSRHYKISSLSLNETQASVYFVWIVLCSLEFWGIVTVSPSILKSNFCNIIGWADSTFPKVFRESLNRNSFRRDLRLSKHDRRSLCIRRYGRMRCRRSLWYQRNSSEEKKKDTLYKLPHRSKLGLLWLLMAKIDKYGIYKYFNVIKKISFDLTFFLKMKTINSKVKSHKELQHWKPLGSFFGPFTSSVAEIWHADINIK